MWRSAQKHLVFARQIESSEAQQQGAFHQMGHSADEHHLVKRPAPKQQLFLQKEHSAVEKQGAFLLLERSADEHRHVKHPVPEQQLSLQM